jgi:hypothetical protein
MQKNATTVIAQQAKRINELGIKEIISWAYTLIYMLIQEEQGQGEVALEIARLTQETHRPAVDTEGEPIIKNDGTPETVKKTDQELIAELPSFIPENEIDIRVVGFNNIQERDKQALAFQTGVPLLAQSPAAMFLKWDDVGEMGLRAMGIKPEDIYMNADERKQAEEKASQQAQAEQEAAMQAAQMQHDLQIRMIETDYAKTERKAVVDEARNFQTFSVDVAKLEQEAQANDTKVNLEWLKLRAMQEPKEAESKETKKASGNE